MQSSSWTLFRSKSEARMRGDTGEHSPRQTEAPNFQQGQPGLRDASSHASSISTTASATRKSSRSLSNFLTSSARQLRKSSSSSPSKQIEDNHRSASSHLRPNTGDASRPQTMSNMMKASAAQGTYRGVNSPSDHSHPHTSPLPSFDSSVVDEREINRHLADMESSFVPTPLANRYPYQPGIPSFQSSTDSHLRSPPRTNAYVSSPSRSTRAYPPSSSAPATPHGRTAQRLHYDSAQRLVGREPDLEQSEQGTRTVAHEHSLSSPTAAAAQRSRLRAGAETTFSQSLAYGSPGPQIQQLPSGLPSNGSGREHLTDGELQQKPIDEPSESQPPTQHDAVVPSIETTYSEEDQFVLDPDGAARPIGMNAARASLSRRPAYLQSHQSSQRSSASSFLTQGTGAESIDSRATLRPELNRVPSLGSVASSVSDYTELGTSRRRRGDNDTVQNARPPPLDRLSEEPYTRSAAPETPQPSATPYHGPTDTVLAKHVRDIQVPDTVARDYKASLNSDADGRSSTSKLTFGRGKSELTLKEQNGRIDKLSKENFDLKLKIHYLYQALQDRSDEGVKDLAAKNAQLQTDMIKAKKEMQSLRRKFRDLQGQRQDRNGADASAQGQEDDVTDSSSQAFRSAQMEEELQYLRDRIQALEEHNDALQQQAADEKSSRAILGERMRSVGIADDILDDMTGAAEEDWRLALHSEMVLRREAEAKNRALIEEINQLQDSVAATLPSMRSQSGFAGGDMEKRGTSLSGSTLVEQLRVENAHLKRDLSAQTSMLSSRNREKERLQQEIEDLKIVSRRWDGSRSMAGDSILDRSVSRSNLRPTSRQSAATAMSDQDREHYETVQASLRDENSALKLRIQDLQRQHEGFVSDSEQLHSLREQRDRAMRLMEEDADWAESEISKRDGELAKLRVEIEQLLDAVDAQDQENKSLQAEITLISDSLARVAGHSEDSHSTIKNLREELITTTGEIEALERHLQEANESRERLEVQAESSKSEIAFLREEQESDKLKIGDLHSALRNARSDARGDNDRLREIEELELELRQARDETRRLRREVTTKDEDLVQNQSELQSLESRLREAFGPSDGTRSGLVRCMFEVQENLEKTLAELEVAKDEIEQRERVLGDRNALLDSHAAERRRLLELLDHEKHARRQDQATFEQTRMTGDNAPSDAKIAALEQKYHTQLQERNALISTLWQRLTQVCGSRWLQKYGIDKVSFTVDSLTQNFSSIHAPLEQILKAIENTVGSFEGRLRKTESEMVGNLNALSAAMDEKTLRLNKLENMVKRAGIVDKSAYDELKAAKHENRSLRKELKILKQGAFALPGLPSPVEDLERAAAAAAVEERRRQTDTPQNGTRSHNSSLSSQGNDTSTIAVRHSVYDPEVDQAIGHPTIQPERQLNNFERTRASQPVVRSSSQPTETAGGTNQVSHHQALAPSEQRWMLRLKELEKRLIKEREGRLLDRSGARARLEENRLENRDLKQALERERSRREFQSGVASATNAALQRGDGSPN